MANKEIGGNFVMQVRDFRYDMRNRLKSSTEQGSKANATTYTYDANGNITGLTRNNAEGKQFDNLTCLVLAALQAKEEAPGLLVAL